MQTLCDLTAEFVHEQGGAVGNCVFDSVMDASLNLAGEGRHCHFTFKKLYTRTYVRIDAGNAQEFNQLADLLSDSDQGDLIKRLYFINDELFWTFDLLVEDFDVSSVMVRWTKVVEDEMPIFLRILRVMRDSHIDNKLAEVMLKEVKCAGNA